MAAFKKSAWFLSVTAMSLAAPSVWAQETGISRAEFEAVIERLTALEAENAALKALVAAADT